MCYKYDDYKYTSFVNVLDQPNYDNRAVYEIMRKNVVKPDKPQMAIFS
jgi:hypothetical protein